MDIKSAAVAQTSFLHLRDANDELMHEPGGAAVGITLHSPGSKPYAKAQAAQSNRMMDKLRRKGKADQSADQKAAEQAEFLAECTVAFHHIDYDELQGDALFRAVYLDNSIGFIVDQVAKHLGDWANFSKSAAKPS